MATHELKIKATVDTSQIQQELTRINQQREQVQNGPQNGAAQPGSKAMLNLDSTLKQLNRTLQQLASSMQKQNQTLARSEAKPSEGGDSSDSQLGYVGVRSLLKNKVKRSSLNSDAIFNDWFEAITSYNYKK